MIENKSSTDTFVKRDFSLTGLGFASIIVLFLLLYMLGGRVEKG
ncbi:hypothetical protein [Methanohalophilus sp.]|nr:hypothetical protein [Methanohalophilus sp.]